jgi:hypothetical protein
MSEKVFALFFKRRNYFEGKFFEKETTTTDREKFFQGRQKKENTDDEFLKAKNIV